MSFSIRYKFVVSLILLSAACLLSYILLVKLVFEKDKEASIFESTSQQNKIYSQSLNQKIDEVFSLSQNLVRTLDNGKFNETSKKLLGENEDFLFIALISGNKVISQMSGQEKYNETQIKEIIEKKYPFFMPLNSEGDVLLTMNVESLDSEITQEEKSVDSATKNKTPLGAGSDEIIDELKILIGYNFQHQINSFVFNQKSGGSFIVYNNQTPIGHWVDSDLGLIQNLIKNSSLDAKKAEFAFLSEYKEEEFLGSYINTDRPQLYIFTAIPKKFAFASLYRLYSRSLHFFVIVIFVVIGVAVLMSGSLLRHLGKLTQATIEISKGQFDLTLNIKSKDEFASLGKSFENMSKEIKRLLVETQEKARMESELKTAQMVQNTLFPPGKFKTDNLEVEGVHRSASECGGDWWFYFKHATGFYGIIADATGHGAGAALITAAAKSAINLMKVQKDLNLLKLTQALNHALYETAYGEILMTGFIFHFDLNSNLFAINASHEPPVVINNSELDFLLLDVSPRLGQKSLSEFKVVKVDYKEKPTFVFYTDGIPGQTNEKSKEFGDRRFMKTITKLVAEENFSLEELHSGIFREVDEFRGTKMQQDDLTLLTIRMTG